VFGSYIAEAMSPPVTAPPASTASREVATAPRDRRRDRLRERDRGEGVIATMMPQTRTPDRIRGMSGLRPDEAPGRDGGTRTPREGVDDEVLEFAQMLFQLAREGGTERLAAYVDAGVSADLTNERGDAFLMLAVYNGHPDTVRALLDRGADP